MKRRLFFISLRYERYGLYGLIAISLAGAPNPAAAQQRALNPPLPKLPRTPVRPVDKALDAFNYPAHQALPPLPATLERDSAAAFAQRVYGQPAQAGKPTHTRVGKGYAEYGALASEKARADPGADPAMNIGAATEAKRGKAAAASPLEGSPVPLAPPQRLKDAPPNRSDATRAAIDHGQEGQEDDAANAPISLAFHNADLPAVLKAFADFTGLNIIASERVHGAVSLRLDRVPWRRAFNTLLDVQGLAMQRHGNIIWVAPLDEVAARERLRLETHARAADLEPLASRLFTLQYQRADEVRKLLASAGAQRILSKRGAAIADARTNQLFVTDLAARIDQIQAMLAAIDRPLRQVSIEARIVEAEEGFSHTLGARLALLDKASNPPAQPAPRAARVAELANGALYELPAGPLAGFNAAAAGFTLFGAAAARILALELSALEADGRGRILSSPRVVTADHVKALIEQGTELPYQAKVGNGVSGVQFRRASLKLEVMPDIMADGQVLLNVDVSKDSVGAQTLSGPAINTKHVRTQVQIENGGTVVIGGIFTQDARTDITRVPWLGELPLIGALFRHRERSDRKSELLVFITPKVMTQAYTTLPDAASLSSPMKKAAAPDSWPISNGNDMPTRDPLRAYY